MTEPYVSVTHDELELLLKAATFYVETMEAQEGILNDRERFEVTALEDVLALRGRRY